ncbi:Wadjet anti-phage system protein JetD domain-containing protein [Bacillus sp. FJAT-50079]|uniref:Wadjet anti-phage system protein JetD domain-containing protein n=1 Tax=Bacillus sp. FJAT-50079 TaxID=2833577 RepID=UPI001BC8EE98|nr:Wadjet anti-phage system protein JetD domain-containing protein [Bacillus sp. FJAT-50079]MBS4208060.1 DUF2399 domain-containing protein [Bacillus sp. FJAT-50079]
MERSFRRIIESFLLERKQLGFTLEALEEYVIGQTKNMNTYIDRGGNGQLKKDILSFQEESKITPVKSKIKEIHRALLLPNHWRKNKEKTEETWTRSYVLTRMTKLDLKHFIRYPGNQTALNKDRIDAIYSFLETPNRELVSAEERMYELFKKEKWLLPEPNGENGQRFLSKIKISLDDLKAKKFPEPIPYETRNRMPLSEVQTVLIIENNSFYHSVRRSLEVQENIAGIPVDMIVYARGKQTIANLEYLYALFEQPTQKQYYYVGDLDPEGYSIFAQIRRKYDDLSINIAKNIYEWMLREEPNPPVVGKGQRKNRQDFQLFLHQFDKVGNAEERAKLENMWKENKRIPQEVLNYEKLTRKK